MFSWVSFGLPPCKKREMQIYCITTTSTEKNLTCRILKMFLITTDIKHSKATMLSYCMLWKIKVTFLNLLYFSLC